MSKLSPLERKVQTAQVDSDTGLIVKEEARDIYSFVRVPRRPTRKELEDDGGVIVIGNSEHKAIIVPDIGLQCLRDLRYLTVAEAIIGWNPRIAFNEELIQDIWYDLVYNFYSFVHEDDRAKKASSVNTTPRTCLDIS